MHFEYIIFRQIGGIPVYQYRATEPELSTLSMGLAQFVDEPDQFPGEPVVVADDFVLPLPFFVEQNESRYALDAAGFSDAALGIEQDEPRGVVFEQERFGLFQRFAVVDAQEDDVVGIYDDLDKRRPTDFASISG